MTDELAKPLPDGAVAARPVAAILLAGLLGAIVAGTIALWAHYGTTVFFESLRAGFVACFG